MVKQDPQQSRRSASSWAPTAAGAARSWLRTDGWQVLAVAGVLMVALWVWPLGVQRGPGVNGAGGTGGLPSAGDDADRAWVQLSLRRPLAREEESIEVETYEDEPISEVVLVGLSYRHGGRSVGFFRIDGGGTEILAEEEESQGMKVLRLAKDHAVVERDGERMELRRILDSDGGGGMM